MSHNPWMTIGAALIKGAYANHRAHSRIEESFVGEEREIGRTHVVYKNGLFDTYNGILAVTTHAVRFEKSSTISGGLAKGSICIPLSRIRATKLESGVLWGGTVSLRTTDGDISFAFSSGDLAEKAKKLIHSLCSE